MGGGRKKWSGKVDGTRHQPKVFRESRSGVSRQFHKLAGFHRRCA